MVTSPTLKPFRGNLNEAIEVQRGKKLMSTEETRESTEKFQGDQVHESEYVRKKGEDLCEERN